ncbi:MAG: hypothetical protein ATN34_00610 [Epulopiscium sp. Nele67-Bin002]|nr:MAG: hypothetical protein ATN34_00610 [Epulopiscium sp. Nele67-Bin002]OON91927.1 MAG: hypothetical protein ATN33_08300 [Epulopiscium sp. Nele67-Bin001]
MFSNINAWYVKYLPIGYAIVHNSLNNPPVIEFGETNNVIDKMYEENNEVCIIYNCPWDVYETNNKINPTLSVKHDLYHYYPDLLEDNNKLITLLSETKRQLEAPYGNLLDVIADGDYGFIDLNKLPSSNIKSEDTI